jgi:hypothetical protein
MTIQVEESPEQKVPLKKVQNAHQQLSRSGIGMIIALVVQYILGMINNFFVTFPDTTDRGVLWRYAYSHFSEAAHIIIGILMVPGAIVLLVRSIQNHDRNWIIASAVGFAGIFISFASGGLFVTTQSDSYSLVMSYGFIAALVAYAWGLYSAKKQP